MLVLLLLLAPFLTHAQPRLVWSTPYGERPRNNVQFSADGRTILSIGRVGATAVDAATRSTLYHHHSYFYHSFVVDDGQALLTIGGVGGVVKYDLRTWEILSRGNGFNVPITYVSMSGNRRWMCTWDDGRVAVWNVESLDTIATLRLQSLSHVAVSEDGTRIACTFHGSLGRPASIYSVGESVPRMSVGEGETYALFSQSGDTLYTTSNYSLLTMWEVKTGNRLKQEYWSLIPGGFWFVTLIDKKNVLVCGQSLLSSTDLSLLFTAEGKFWFTNDDDTLRVLNSEGLLTTFSVPEYRKVAERILRIDSVSVAHANISPNGDEIVWTTPAGEVVRSSLRTNTLDTLLHTIKPSYLSTLPSVHTIVGKVDGDYTTWDLASGRVTSTFSRSGPFSTIKVTDTTIWLLLDDTLDIRSLRGGDLVHRVTFDPLFHSPPVCLPMTNKIIGQYTNKTLRAVDVKTGAELWSIPTYPGSYHRYIASPTERMFAVIVHDTVHRAFIHATDDGALLQTLILKTDQLDVEALFHPDDRRFIVVTGYRDPNVKVWDISTGDSTVVMRPSERFLFSPTLLSDGRTLLTTDWSTTISRWDIETGALVRSIALDTIGRNEQEPKLIVDPTSTYLAMGEGLRTVVYDLSTDTVIAVLPSIQPRAFDTTGSHLVTVNGSQMYTDEVSSILIWDVKGRTSSASEHHGKAPTLQITASPNPVTLTSTATVQFASPSGQGISISDLTGRVLLTLPGSGTLDPQHFTIERGLLPSAGPFYLTASDSSSTSTILLLAL